MLWLVLQDVLHCLLGDPSVPLLPKSLVRKNGDGRKLSCGRKAEDEISSTDDELYICLRNSPNHSNRSVSL